jgi:hypothetical protein
MNFVLMMASIFLFHGLITLQGFSSKEGGNACERMCPYLLGIGFVLVMIALVMAGGLGMED